MRAGAINRMKKAKLNVLTIEYAEMVGGEGNTAPIISLEVARRICMHIGVCEYPLSCELKRVHQHPLKAMIENWQDVELVIANSEFAQYLEHEMAWRNVGGKWKI